MTEDWVLALVGSPWVFVALFALTTIDGFFPPVPSESVVIALSVLAIANGEPNLWLVGVVAATGAFTGDQIAYVIGRRVPVHRVRMLQGRHATQAAAWAERALSERGAAFIMGARFIPIGRVAVNMTAGSVGYSRGRFTLLTGLGAVIWAVYSVGLGVGAGVWLGDNKIGAIAVGVVIGLTMGVLIDTVIKLAMRRSARRSGTVPGDPHGPEPLAPRTHATAAPQPDGTPAAVPTPADEPLIPVAARGPATALPGITPLDPSGPHLVQTGRETA